MNETLFLPHPVEYLKIYESQKQDALGLPELFIARDSTVSPYMPSLMGLRVIGKARFEAVDNGNHKFFFKLSHEANDILQLFFENHHNENDVTFEGDMLIITCGPQELSGRYDEIYNALFRALRDYCEERRKLAWQVFMKMEEQNRRDQIEAEIRAEHESYREKRQERVRIAEKNGWSVAFVCENFNSHYREILENKFRWWSRILDASTIGKYRAMFEFDFLSV